MRKILLSLGMVVAFAVVACSSSQTTVVKTDKAIQSRESQNMDGIKRRFKQAYMELACMANPGVDPTMNVVPLRRPEDFLKRAQKGDPAQLSLAMDVLKKYGFFTVQDFFDTMRNLKMDPTYWNSVENAFLQALQNCK